jgi:hypothetical protein
MKVIAASCATICHSPCVETSPALLTLRNLATGTSAGSAAALLSKRGLPKFGSMASRQPVCSVGLSQKREEINVVM